jgi:DNA-binding PadR family transcriptional regulator
MAKLFDESSQTVLKLLISSTAKDFYVGEIVEKTGYSWTTLCPLLVQMTDAGLLSRYEETDGFATFSRRPKIYYHLQPQAIKLLRLQG